jgi:sugar phosphate permease
MSEAGAAIQRFDFDQGAMRGSSMTLYASCLVHRSDLQLETLPLAALSSVRVAFERNQGRISWGAALIVLALIMVAVSGPLAAISGSAAGEVATGATGVAAALHGFFRFIESVAKALPVLAALAGLGGAALAGLGWLGSTSLTLTFAGGERLYPVRGRNTRLLDFAEAVAERLTQLKR